MLVTPPAAAYLLTRRLPVMMLVSAIIGVASSILGLYASYYLDISTGGAIVLVATAIFVLEFLFAPRDGILWRISRRAAAPRG
jgi:ABC-type Mn2+/Zn2+ transport system permease subunit